MKELDVFIQGETMDLCIPTEAFARESSWYSWFNDPSITRFLEQGLFPNTPEEQVEFFNSQGRDRLILIISNKKEYIGTKLAEAESWDDVSPYVDEALGQIDDYQNMTQLLEEGDIYLAVQGEEVPGDWEWYENPPEGIRTLSVVKVVFGNPLFYLLTLK